MCADSITKIKSSSLLDMPNSKKVSFIDAEHAKEAFNQFAEFHNQEKFTDITLSGSDHRKLVFVNI